MSPTTWRWYVVGGLAAALLAVLVPAPHRGVAMAAVQVSAVFAGVVGLVWHRSGPVSPWALLLLARGSAVTAVCLGIASAHPGAKTTAVGALMLLPYPLVATSAAVLARRRSRSFWDGILAAAVPAVGLTLLTWTFLVLPLADNDRLAGLRSAAMVVYAGLDVVVAVMLGRGLLRRAGRSPSTILFAVAAAALVAGDAAVYQLDRLPQAAAVAWLASAMILAAACLHPSVARREAEPANRERPERPKMQIGAYAGAALLAPGVPVAAALAGIAPGSILDTAISAGLAGVLCALIVARFALFARQAERRAAWLARQKAILDGRATGLDQHATALDMALQEHREQQRDLEYRATHDPLTMLGNRTLLGDRLDRALASVGRHSGIALLLLDLDGFKAVNDTLGHLAGDELLRAVAHRLTEVVPAHQTLARLGGDEFAVLLTGVREAAGALALSHEILAALSRPYPLGDATASVTVSIGVRHLPRFHGESAADMMRNADTAMYSAKRSGKNRVALYGAQSPATEPALCAPRLEPAGG